MKDVVFFYCSHQEAKVARALTNLNGSEAFRARKVPLPCSGKLEVYQLTRALENGADAVGLFGCGEESCRYAVGSTRAKGRVQYAGTILKAIGLEPERVRRFVLSGQGDEAADADIRGWLEEVAKMPSLPRVHSI